MSGLQALIDFRFTDTKGKEHHVTIPASEVNDSFFEEGKMFDGSSISGWKGINESDMILMPDPTTAVMDPFSEESTLIIRCDILEPATMEGYERDPRSVARRAEAYLKSTGIGDTAFFAALNRMGERSTLLVAETLAPIFTALLAVVWISEILNAYLMAFDADDNDKHYHC